MKFFCCHAHWIVVSHVMHALDQMPFVPVSQIHKEHVQGPRRKNVVALMGMKV